jgi:glycolate oxidase
LPIAAFGGPMNQLFGPHCYNYHEVIMKIKEKLDPNSSYDSWTYSGASEKAFADEKEGYTFF